VFSRGEPKERVQAVDLGLHWDVGAPLPHLLQSERRTFIAFYLPDPPPGWDGTFVEVVDPASPQPAPLGVIEWLGCRGAVLGGPNDEACQGHRLWNDGLSDVGWYRAAEVTNSRWISDLEKANRVHPRHRPESYASYRHFILGFHDSTFECIAIRFRAWATMTSMPEALVTLAAHLDDRSDLPFDEVKPG
jgi:hypothetical protein